MTASFDPFSVPFSKYFIIMQSSNIFVQFYLTNIFKKFTIEILNMLFQFWKDQFKSIFIINFYNVTNDKNDNNHLCTSSLF